MTQIRRILTSAQMKQEIQDSHARSEQYGISREDRSPDQKRLSPAALGERKKANQNLVEVVLGYIDEFYDLLSPERFVIALVDREGYILHFAGNDELKAEFALGKRAAQSRSTVLLLGETGTGKELFAQAIHNAGPCGDQSFIPINCGAIPGELMESELFGYVDGAFTGALKGGRAGKFELADNGTLLLDEIGDMPHDMQVKLLRVLQTGEIQRIGSDKMLKVNTRIIASTHVNLTQAIQHNKFRPDLYYRLNILSITIPPLRERGATDILALATYFIRKNNPACRLTPGAREALAAYDWPGNVRELENTIQRALHRCDGSVLEEKHLGLPGEKTLSQGLPRGSLQEMEQKLIQSTLGETGFNMAATARKLGISRATLYRKVNACPKIPGTTPR